ncbi:Gamma-crystallin B [Nibea albiflora]|uniref:Gamma-crystallin B n=1 Tax=Nibea albiflora TaxID=240163 RepID=A0ACB7EQN8_NIBAL|nr:Gamma-crystallin B [Nibea albiflora]
MCCLQKTTVTALTHRFGAVIPNRIFVGGIDYRVNESDLRHVFSQHGTVKEVKIVTDRTGLSKGYGFVTFETQDDALRILRDANGVCFKDKKLSIGQAVRRQQSSGQSKRAPMAFPAMHLPMSCMTQYHTTSTGYPYTYHNGVAYFHCPSMNPPAQRWPRMAPPVMAPQSHQPVYQQPAYHHYQCVPNQHQWNVVQSPMPPAPVVYSHPSEYLYQSADGGSVQPPLAVMEDTTPEFIEPTVQQVYPLHPPRTEAVTPIVLHHNHMKIVFYEDRNFQGRHHECMSDCADLHPYFNRCNSIRVESGCFMVYERPQYLGNQYFLRRGEYSDNQRMIGINDCIRSCRMIPMHHGSYKIRLYERPDMVGQMQELGDNCPNVQERVHMSEINSINVVQGHWLLYDQPSYRGRIYYLRPGEYRRYSDWGSNSARIGSIRQITDFN